MKATVDCETAGSVQGPDMDVLQGKVVDCRREKVFLRELQYLSRKFMINFHSDVYKNTANINAESSFDRVVLHIVN